MTHPTPSKTSKLTATVRANAACDSPNRDGELAGVVDEDGVRAQDEDDGGYEQCRRGEQPQSRDYSRTLFGAVIAARF